MKCDYVRNTVKARLNRQDFVESVLDNEEAEATKED